MSAGRNPKIGGEKSREGQALIRFQTLSPVDGTPPPPAELEPDAVEAWVEACRSLIPMRLLAHIDLLALEMFASAFGRWRRAERRCRKEGNYFTTGNGYRQLTPWRIDANKALAQVMAIGAKFGMTPVERIKTTESAQGDLPLGDAAPEIVEADDGADQKVTSLFRPRPVQGRADG